MLVTRDSAHRTIGLLFGKEACVVFVIRLVAVVLLFLVDDRVERSTALAHGKGSELGEDVGLFDVVALADVFDLGDDLLGQVLVIVVEVERVLYGECAADVEAVQFRTDLLQLAVEIHALRKFIPIVGRIADAGIDEEMQHLELKLLVVLDQFHQRNVVELQFAVLHRELILREIECLFDQVDVLVFHDPKRAVFKFL